ncbi:MAG: hypothetical protein JWQ11_331 [Rhizobacter sp.]|nr:hypothetical protein [Rhizobacter sp.]
MNNPVVWFEIYVADMPRAKAFYQSMLGVELSALGTPATSEPGFEMFAFPADMNGPGATGTLVRMPGFEPGANSVLVYFGCDDCAVVADKAVNAGGRIQKPKMSIGPHGFIALVFDSEGNMIGLHSMK